MKNFVQMVQNEYMMTEKAIEHFIVEAGDMAIDYLEQNNLNGIVLGLSGGLDSTVSAYIIRKAIERRKSDKKLLGINICIGNSEEHLRYADEVGKITCDAYLQFDEFKDSFKSFNESVSKSSDLIKAAGLEVSKDPVSMGNLKARLRMMILYDIAKKSNCIVLGSDNRSETQNGFFTIHGDGACDMNLLYDIYKGLQLWQIAKALDMNTTLNGSFVTSDSKIGVFLFGVHRNREAYDRDDDGFSEIPTLNSSTVGFRSYFKTSDY